MHSSEAGKKKPLMSAAGDTGAVTKHTESWQNKDYRNRRLPGVVILAWPL